MTNRVFFGSFLLENFPNLWHDSTRKFAPLFYDSAMLRFAKFREISTYHANIRHISLRKTPCYSRFDGNWQLATLYRRCHFSVRVFFVYFFYSLPANILFYKEKNQYKLYILAILALHPIRAP